MLRQMQHIEGPDYMYWDDYYDLLVNEPEDAAEVERQEWARYERATRPLPDYDEDG